MPGPVVHLGATVTCTHAGPATPAAPFPRVLVSGQPVVTLATPYVITGCALTGSPKWRVAAMASAAFSNWCGPSSAGGGRSSSPASS